MITPFEVNIKSNKRTLTMVFIAVWLLGVTAHFISKRSVEGKEYLFIFISILAFIYFLWLNFGSIKLILTAEKLVIERKISSVIFSRDSFNLSGIDNISKLANDIANTHWDRGLIKDTNPIVIYFDYNGQSKKIGEGLEEFNADKIISQIKLRKKALAKNI